MLDRPAAAERQRLLRRFWRSACGFWLTRSNGWAALMAALMIVMVVLQLAVQYRLNFWSRDFFNAIGQRDGVMLWRQAEHFVPLAFTSLTIAVVSVWGRMTLEREWRRWLSRHLYDYWLRDGRHTQLKFIAGDHQTPEYRIADDAKVATELPVDLTLGLLSSLLRASAFISVLYRAGGSLALAPFGFELVVPDYLVVAVLVYSMVLTSATLLIGRRMTRVIEQNKAAEAHLRATGSRLRVAGEATRHASAADNRHIAGINAALDGVIARWRALCWQLMRMTMVTQANVLVAPAVGALLCAPKYLGGAMSLGDLVQAAAAFVVVQGAFNWFSDNYGRVAEWSSSANRVASLLQSLDRLHGGPQPRSPAEPEQGNSRGSVSHGIEDVPVSFGG